MAYLRSTTEVIDQLGGIRPVAEMTGPKYDAAEQWKRFTHFPPDTYLVLKKALEGKGHTAPLSLWRMIEPAT